MDNSLFFIKGEINRWYRYYKNDFEDKELLNETNIAIKNALLVNSKFCNHIIYLTNVYLYNNIKFNKLTDNKICKDRIRLINNKNFFDWELSISLVINGIRYINDESNIYTDDIILTILDSLDKDVLYRLIGFISYCKNKR